MMRIVQWIANSLIDPRRRETRHPSSDHGRDPGTLITAHKRPPAGLYQRLHRITAGFCRIPVLPEEHPVAGPLISPTVTAW